MKWRGNIDLQGASRIINMPPPENPTDGISLEYLENAEFDFSGTMDFSNSQIILPKDLLPPTGPQEGQIFWNTNESNMYVWDGATWVNITLAASLPKIVYVTIEGSDITGNGTVSRPYATIKHALSTITDASSINPYTIIVSPGIYTEDNPVNLKSYVSLRGSGGTIANTIKALNTNQDLINGINASSLRYFTLEGATGAAGFLMNTPGYANIVDIKIKNCQNGIIVSNAYAAVNCSELEGSTTGANVISNLVYVTAGAMATVHVVASMTSNITSVFHADGANVVIQSGQSIIMSNTTNGLFAENGGSISCADIGVKTATYTIRARTNGEIKGDNVFSGNISTYDIFQEDSTGIVALTSSTLDVRKISVVDWSNITVDFVSLQEDNPGHHFAKTLNVGIAEKGYDTCLGEGFPTVRGMRIYNYDNAAFTDMTIIAASPSGSTFTMGTDVDDAIYITWDLINSTTSDYSKFFGIYTDVSSALVNGGGYAIWEYWNGSSWANINEMVTQAEPAYFPSDGHSFETTGLSNIRFSNYESNHNWQKNNPLGTGNSTYWLRFRVVSAITTGATIQYIKIHTNRAKVNGDGWIEYFGNARPVGRLAWDWGLTEAAGQNSPDNQELYVSDDLSVGRIENSFSKGALDKVGFVTNLPFDLDTSCPINLSLRFISSSAGGTVRWVAKIAKTADGDGVYTSTSAAPATAPSEVSITKIVDVPLSETQVTVNIQINIRDMISRRSGGTGDMLWIGIERDGSLDSNGGNISVINLTPYYTRWCEGGHSTD